METIGFNFTELSIKDSRGSKSVGKSVDVDTNLSVLSIKEIKTEVLKTKNEIIGVEFEYKVDYNPDIAKVYIKGKVVLSLDPKIAKETIKEWDQKRVSKDIRSFLFNIILKKSTLKALELEDTLNLPLHIPMPSFKE